MSNTPPSSLWENPTLRFPATGNLFEQLMDFFNKSEENKRKLGILDSDELVELFEEYEEYDRQGEYKKEEEEQDVNVKKVAKKIRKFLFNAQISTCILSLDWSVDRVKAAEQSLWLREGGTLKLQETLKNKYYPYKKPKHLHKGPWDGTFMHYLSQKSNEWEQIGVGDKLYFTIEWIFRKIVPKEIIDNPFLSDFLNYVIWSLVKIELKEKYSWDVRRLGDALVDISLNFKDKLKILYNRDNLSLKVSKYHPLDDQQRVPVKIAILIEFLLNPDWDFSKLKKEFENQLVQIWERLNQIEVKSTFSLGDRKFLKREFNYSGIISRRPTDAAYKKNLFSIFREQLTREVNELKNLSENRKELYPYEWIWDFLWFTGLLNFNPEKLDYWVSIEKFFQSSFLEMNEIPEIWGEKFWLITSIRADSHESDEDFKQDIEKHLSLLDDRWVLLVDGIRQSYTNYYRFKQIDEIMQKVWDWYKAEYIKWRDGKIKSIYIQKFHESWYLVDTEKEEIFEEGCDFIPYAQIWDNISWVVHLSQKIKRWIKNKLWDGYNDNIENFRWIQIPQKIVDTIKEQVRNIVNVSDPAITDIWESAFEDPSWIFWEESILDKIEKMWSKAISRNQTIEVHHEININLWLIVETIINSVVAQVTQPLHTVQ